MIAFLKLLLAIGSFLAGVSLASWLYRSKLGHRFFYRYKHK